MVDTLFVYYRHKPGGLCKRLYRAMDACAQRGDKVTFLTLDPPPAKLHPNVSVRCIPFFISKREGLFFWGVFTLYLPIVLFLFSLQNTPKRIIAFGPYYAAMSLPSRLLLGRRVYLFLRSLTFRIDTIKGKPRWLRVITGAVDYVGIKTASAVIAMTNVMRSDAAAFSGRALEVFPVLPNDIPTRDVIAKSVSADCREFLFAGVLEKRKNIEVLIRAWKILEGYGSPNSILHIVGDGPGRAQLESLCSSVGVQGIKFHGWQSNLTPFLEHTSLYLHPSVHEGISNSLVEALSAGIPVIASDIPEHREIFCAEALPINLAAPNNPEIWANMVHKFQAEPLFNQQIKAICSRTSKNLTFDWDRKFFDITRF